MAEGGGATWGALSTPRPCVEEVRLVQVCRGNPGEKGKYIKIILALLQNTSTAVVYECAVTLVGLSQAPTAIRAAANCYCQLLVSQSDNNVKLIVLDRLQVSTLLSAHLSQWLPAHGCLSQMLSLPTAAWGSSTCWPLVRARTSTADIADSHISIALSCGKHTTCMHVSMPASIL